MTDAIKKEIKDFAWKNCAVQVGESEWEPDQQRHEDLMKGSNFGFSLAMREAQVLVEFIEHAEMFSQCIVTRMRAKQALEQFKERTGNGNR